MNGLSFQHLSLWANVGIFAVAAVVVWIAGTRLSTYAEELSERTGIGAAFVGALLLGGITSLPELMTTVTASLIGNAPMAVNNIFGGVAMQVAVLALADATVRGRPLSSAVTSPVILLQGTLFVMVLSLALAAMITGEPRGWPVGAWTSGIFVTVVLAFYVIHGHERQSHRHLPGEGPQQPSAPRAARPGAERTETRRRGRSGNAGTARDRRHERSNTRLVANTIVAALAILVAGYVATRNADALAEKTALGSSFVGVLILALATSLPEVSTTIAAARLDRYDMAFANIFGANILDVGLLFVADLAYGGRPVLGEVGRFSQFGAVLGIVLTTVFLVGIHRRSRRSVFWMGPDSVLVLLLYVAGVYALYMLR